jgi:hypothetical protein
MEEVSPYQLGVQAAAHVILNAVKNLLFARDVESDAIPKSRFFVVPPQNDGARWLVLSNTEQLLKTRNPVNPVHPCYCRSLFPVFSI